MAVLRRTASVCLRTLLSVLTTDQKGIIAETKIAAFALAAGIGVARPLGDERYDLIFDVGDRLLRIQCKWAVKLDQVVVIRCRRVRRGPHGLIRRTYLPGEIDAIVGYCAEIEECFYLPAKLSVERAAVQLRLAPTRNNQSVGIKWARDFELGATLHRLRGPIAQLGERVAGSDEVVGSSPTGSTL
jgi:PD-(D/E)XK endonuclease